KCVESIIGKGDVAKWADCFCPTPCENSQFEATFTMAPFVRNRNKCGAYNKIQRENATEECEDLSGKPDYVIINVQVPRLSMSIFEETPAWTLNRLIGTIGGLGGVVCGINLITFVEFGFLFLIQLPLILFFNRQF
ncbi:hypothetical protein PFISCL1PPCAC_26631, partial [Pristionchus fissidentatus]